MSRKQQKLTCGYQQEYTLLQEKGMPKEPTLEHLVAELPANVKSFSVNRFRSLDPDPPERDDPQCNRVREEWQGMLEADEVLEVHYRRLERARRLLTELEVAQRMLKAELATCR